MNTCVMQINKMPKLISRCINCGTQQLSMVSKVTKKKKKKFAYLRANAKARENPYKKLGTPIVKIILRLGYHVVISQRDK